MQIKRQYIVDESNRRVAVQLDMETFAKIEEALEDVGLIRAMEEVHFNQDDDETLDLEQAQLFYRSQVARQ
ncbi:hypothetical protein [Halochromatium roseum]|uniref:hypothetical protein n=1 Tax=Halochromatium roseum TaxID=391920 RepID=UPI001914C1C1|nr:hypothetical protein [Halochromatium roseum]MBK5941949.1 hypothetical protein [Halochromatium roseum]